MKFGSRPRRFLAISPLVAAVIATTFSTSAAFTISGTVRNNAAAPVASVNVLLFDENDNPIGIPTTLTDGLGLYSILNVPNGRYNLKFEPPTSLKLLDKRVLDVRVESANVTLNVTLDAGRLLSGFVRSRSGAAIPDIDLQVQQNGNPVELHGDNTDASGFYDVVVPNGSINVTWRDVTPAPPSWIAVTMDLDISSDLTVNVTMDTGVFVSGIVRNQAGTPLANANLDFLESDTGIKLDPPGDITDASGFYRVQIPTHTYDVRVKPPAGQRLVAAELKSVVIGQDMTLNFTLQPGVAISGTVRRASNATTVSGVDIDVARSSTGEKVFTPNDVTDAAGFYQVFVLPGTYDVTFQPPVSTLLACMRTTGLVVSADTQASANLVNGVALTGTVRNASNQPVVNADIDVKRSSTQADIPLVGDHTDTAGNFSTVVPPDTYDLEFEPPIALKLIGQRLLNRVITTATNVLVTLQGGIKVSGTATDSVGTLLRNVDVNVVVPANGTVLFTPGDKTDVFGRYAIVVPAGTYRFVFTPDPAVILAAPRTFENVRVSFDKVLNVEFPGMNRTDVGDDGTGASIKPRALVLHQNRPNPFNPSTAIELDLAREGDIEFTIHDARGRIVRRMTVGRLGAGRHRLLWNGTNNEGIRVTSGVYFYRLRMGAVSETRKMMLVE